MSYLQYVLAKVRESDLDQFRQKVEPIEKERDKIVHDKGLELIDDIVQRRSDELTEQSFSAVDIKYSTEDVFANFLKTIRG